MIIKKTFLKRKLNWDSEIKLIAQFLEVYYLFHDFASVGQHNFRFKPFNKVNLSVVQTVVNHMCIFKEFLLLNLVLN